MFLVDFVASYVIASNLERPIGKELAPRTVKHLLECVQTFERYLQRRATVKDLTSAQINAFLIDLAALGRSPYTVKNRRTGLMVLRHFALEKRLVKRGVDAVRRVHCPPLDPEGYDVAAAAVLLAFFAGRPGVVRGTGIPRSIYWESFLLTKWELGLRAGDMLAIEPQHFQADGWLWVRESKTGKSGWLRIRPAVAAAISRCLAARPSRSRVWPGFKARNLYQAFKQLAKAAGVNGTTRWIRRGAGSEYEKLHHGGGWRFLRQSGPQVFEKHYRIRRICDGESPAPPEIPRAG